MTSMTVVELGDICRPKQWPTLSKKELTDKGFPVYGANGKIGFYSSYTHQEPTLLIGCRGSCGSVHITEPYSYANGNAMALDDLNQDRADIKYLYHLFVRRGFRDVITGTSQPQIIQQHIRSVEIPLPPLEEQRRIAGILDKASLLTAKSKAGSKLIESLALERLEQLLAAQEKILDSQILEDLCVLGAPITYGILQPGPDLEDGIPYVRPSEIKHSQIETSKLRKTSREIAMRYHKSELRAGDILLTIVGTIGEVAIVPPGLEGANITQSSCRIRIDSLKANPTYIYYYLKSRRTKQQIERDRLGVAVERLNLHHVRDMEILLPPRDVQERFATEIMSLEGMSSGWSALSTRISELDGSLRHSFLGMK